MLFFLEFSITCRVGTERTYNFYLVSFLAFSNLFWLEKKLWQGFLIFWNFLLFFWNFPLRVGWERNETIIFIFSLYQPFSTYFGLKRSHNRVFQFFEFCCYFFFELSLMRRVGTKWNDNFYFLSFSDFSNLFWLEMKLLWYFWIFRIILLFFWNFLLPVV